MTSHSPTAPISKSSTGSLPPRPTSSSTTTSSSNSNRSSGSLFTATMSNTNTQSQQPSGAIQRSPSYGSSFSPHLQPQSPTQYTPPHTPTYDTSEYYYKPEAGHRSTSSNVINTHSSQSTYAKSKASPTPDDSSPTASTLPPRTKITCTIGPAVQSTDRLKDLLLNGMNVARLNFSHGDHTYHSQTIQNLREVMQQTRRICAIMLDTKG